MTVFCTTGSGGGAAFFFAPAGKQNFDPAKDYYKDLDVPSNATAAEVKRAYRQVVLQYHPDVNPAAAAYRLFTAAQEAYRVLSSPDDRQQYNIARAQLRAGGTFPGGTTTPHAHPAASAAPPASARTAPSQMSSPSAAAAYYASMAQGGDAGPEAQPRRRRAGYTASQAPHDSWCVCARLQTNRAGRQRGRRGQNKDGLERPTTMEKPPRPLPGPPPQSLDADLY